MLGVVMDKGYNGCVGRGDTWAFDFKDGQKMHKGSWSAYTKKIEPDDIVECRVNKSTGELRYSVNGSDQGVAFQDDRLKGQTYFAISARKEGQSFELVE